MDVILQQIVNGLVLGSIYALVALGYTLVYGILGLINFAHGEVTMFGAMVAIASIGFITLGYPGMSPAVIFLSGFVVSVLACMALGFCIERIAYRPLRGSPRLSPLITAIGMSIILQNLAMVIWGKQYIPFPSIFSGGKIVFWGASVTYVQLAILASTLVVMISLTLIVNRTTLGRAMRASAERPDVAGLMGVNVDRIISITFVMGSGLAALAGVMIAANYGQAHYYMGFLIGLKAFSSAVLGGIGNIFGAMLGGLLIGVIESIGAGYIGTLTCGYLGSHYQDIFAFVVLIMVLSFRPSGLLGGDRVERA